MSVADTFRRAVVADDHDTIMALFADDIRFFSPVTFQPFVGVDMVRGLFGVLRRTFQDFRYVGVLTGRALEGTDGADVETHVLVFRTVVGGKQVQGVDVLQVNADGLISTFTVMMRPQSAITAVGEAVYAGLIADGVLPPRQ
jgi:hypothetical protein